MVAGKDSAKRVIGKTYRRHGGVKVGSSASFIVDAALYFLWRTRLQSTGEWFL